ncbi:helix-turn-helix transcriptional regulator [Kiritimatiellaeota bacterium B1221]|nr:helix-turn-helix transcriptional regulator [Kiritimatiellaeota bacterium B1221]
MNYNEFKKFYRDEALRITRDNRPKWNSWEMHTHDFYECFFTTGDGGIHQLIQSDEALERHHLYFIRPEHAHGFKQDARGHYPAFINIVLQFDLVEAFRQRHPGAFPDEVWKSGDTHPFDLELASGQMREFNQIIDSLIFSSRSSINLEWFLASLSRILLPLELDLGHVTLPVWLREGLHQFREPDNLRKGVQGLVKQCRCSHEHLAREMRKHLGKRPVEWINDQKMRYATMLLQTTDLSITEIALEVGVNNLSHFHSLFKKKHQMTPRQFRQSHVR